MYVCMYGVALEEKDVETAVSRCVFTMYPRKTRDDYLNSNQTNV